MTGRSAGIGAVATRPVTAVCLAILFAAIVVALAVPYLGMVSPEAMDALPLQPPGAQHWFGTDEFGRDVFTRVLWGTRVALIVAIGSSAVSTLIGIALGSVSGFYGGWIDGVVSRGFDLFLLIPTFFLVLVIVDLFGSSIQFTMFAIAVTTWPRSARIMRSQVLSLKTRTYVQAALVAGGTNAQVLVRHVIPNGLAPIVTDGTILMGLAILTEAGLSFLGLGDQNTVSWGRMIYDGQRYLRQAPWISIFPGLSLVVLVATLNLLGDALNQALNPHLRRHLNRSPKASRPPVTVDPDEPRAADAPLLEVRDLAVVYHVGQREIRAVDGVSFALARGGSLGVVGESGCGKSSLGAALMQILPANAELRAGTVAIDGRDVIRDGRPTVENGQLRFQPLRWTRIATVFQSSMNALNPVFTVRRQLIDAYRLHRPDADADTASARIGEVFDMIGIARGRLDAYPHELSGGMRQRVMIALALLLEPGLLIADEPTTALDVVIQDQILGEIDALRRRMGMALILISHDMGAVAETCEHVAVMYAGQIVEIAPTRSIYGGACHPYTRALIGSAPALTGSKVTLTVIPGEPASADSLADACRFAPRCAHATQLCREHAPEMVALAADHSAACHYARDFAAAPDGGPR